LFGENTKYLNAKELIIKNIAADLKSRSRFQDQKDDRFIINIKVVHRFIKNETWETNFSHQPFFYFHQIVLKFRNLVCMYLYTIVNAYLICNIDNHFLL
jgi:hypothetical protein